MISNQEKEKILLKLNLTRKDIQALTGFNYRIVMRIFEHTRECILASLRKKDPTFMFYNGKYIPTNLSLPYLKQYGIDKEEINNNAKLERETANAQ